MPRGPRLIVPGIALHVVQRGHNRRDCFQHETDYLVYLANLRELSTRTQCALHAYCLMTNHVHLLLTPSDPQSCARLMRNLGQRYVQYFNRRYQRSGTLWEGRYYSCLVDSSQYVIACYRYIERNQLRPYAEQAPSPHPEYLALAVEDTSRHAAYQGLSRPTIPLALRQSATLRTALRPRRRRVESQAAGRCARQT